MTVSSDENAYCGVIKIDSFRKDFLLGQINELEVAVLDDGKKESKLFPNGGLLP